MSQKIEFNYAGKEYSLEYNRLAIKTMEKQGFELESFEKKPMTMVDIAFEGAFIKNHSNISKATVEEIYSLFKDKKALIKELIRMIQESYSTLFDDENDGVDESKKIDWKIG